VWPCSAIPESRIDDKNRNIPVTESRSPGASMMVK
jgi:hypothetical protein